MLGQAGAGLAALHTRQLAHMDVKPGNILQAREESGLTYKLADFGHVAVAGPGLSSPEEGDCRYMAPELLELQVQRYLLPAADIFSLGLTVYEAASLRPLPRNSLDDPNYENIKRGRLQYLDCYSEDFNNLICSMVNVDPVLRPTANRVVAAAETDENINKPKSQLCKELKKTKKKLFLLEQRLKSSKENCRKKNIL